MCRTDVILKVQALVPGAQEQAAGHAVRLQLTGQLTQTLQVQTVPQQCKDQQHRQLMILLAPEHLARWLGKLAHHHLQYVMLTPAEPSHSTSVQ